MITLTENRPLRNCDIDVRFCDREVSCEECHLYMNDCDGDPEKMEEREDY